MVPGGIDNPAHTACDNSTSIHYPCTQQLRAPIACFSCCWLLVHHSSAVPIAKHRHWAADAPHLQQANFSTRLHICLPPQHFQILYCIRSLVSRTCSHVCHEVGPSLLALDRFQLRTGGIQSLKPRPSPPQSLPTSNNLDASHEHNHATTSSPPPFITTLPEPRP